MIYLYLLKTVMMYDDEYDYEYEKEPTTTDQLYDMITDLETTLIERDEKFQEIMDELRQQKKLLNQMYWILLIL